MEIAYGTVRWQRTLEWVLSRLAKREPSIRLRAILLTGLYQVLFMTRTEDYAIVNEAVELTKRRADPKAAGFVNAILRRAIREKKVLFQQLRRERLGVRLSHPDLLAERWVDRYGERDALRLCAYNNRRARVTIRVRPCKVAFEQYRHLLQEQGVQSTPHPFRPEEFLVIGRGTEVEALPGYDKGWIVGQDPATALAVDLLKLRPGEHVLDACAAPGGKTAMLADHVKDGHVYALDVHRDRIALLEENIHRLGLEQCTVLQANAADPTDPIMKQLAAEMRFDAILIDAPCTNTGVLRRRVDARWRFNKERMETMTTLQSALLQHLPRLLKPSGRMVYSTCSLEPEENRGLLKKLPLQIVRDEILFPPDTKSDGAYAALLEIKKQ
jgi:16S rRNA (cytosine967-C5)-methyltransferase